MFIAWQWIALAVITLLGGAIALSYQRKAEDAAGRLSPEDRQLFISRYITRADRDGMPAKFNDLAAATDRVRGARMGVTVIMAVALLLFLL